MIPPILNHVTGLIGNPPVLKVESLSCLTGCEILLKCENLNPGGSVKDRAALQMAKDSIANAFTLPELNPTNLDIDALIKKYRESKT